MWPFKKRPVFRPFAHLLDAMKSKDPALYREIEDMPFGKGVEIWRETYPEDFEDWSLHVVM